MDVVVGHLANSSRFYMYACMLTGLKMNIHYVNATSHKPYHTQNKNLIEVGQMGIKNGSWLVNILVSLRY